MVYLGLAVWGAIHPMSWFVRWFLENGIDLADLIDAWHVNAATSGLVWDLTISAIALTVWILAEVAVRRNWAALWAIPATFCIGVSCGLPLYLWFRSRPID
ncbi:DUF2834 domain-containing protein [Donghicola tyrosinivorans]|uniref:Uncharacterized protein DUF2834 n=1 Tax=Donghicola tyrosinivorans TaxID=1652492 RepID=A0A2T0X036_9RHOB|nr:DUF2834 domain-containing protein [Donghicola tyrosinivorans]PRY92287.1 uncharacterized protein DUF2834 [Donghicola tyrosinivorans]